MWISYDIQYNYIDTYQHSTFNLPKINNYKDNMDAAIYIYMYVQPDFNYKMFYKRERSISCSYCSFGAGRVKDEKQFISLYC